MKPQHLPDGYHTITPYLVINHAAHVIEFAKTVFGATEHIKSFHDDGTVQHAELHIGDSVLLLADCPPHHPPMPAMLYIFVDDADAIYQKALEAGAESVMAPANQIYGDRNAGVKDASGILWWIGTHIEDVSPDEMKKREAELKSKKS
jgi:uncharacterized glyoxalase superfamily protein PhnB